MVPVVSGTAPSFITRSRQYPPGCLDRVPSPPHAAVRSRAAEPSVRTFRRRRCDVSSATFRRTRTPHCGRCGKSVRLCRGSSQGTGRPRGRSGMKSRRLAIIDANWPFLRSKSALPGGVMTLWGRSSPQFRPQGPEHRAEFGPGGTAYRHTGPFRKPGVHIIPSSSPAALENAAL